MINRSTVLQKSKRVRTAERTFSFSSISSPQRCNGRWQRSLIRFSKAIYCWFLLLVLLNFESSSISSFYKFSIIQITVRRVHYQWHRQKKTLGGGGAKMTSHLMTSYYQWRIARVPSAPGCKIFLCVHQQNL